MALFARDKRSDVIASVIKTLASGGVVSLVCFRAARSRNCSLSARELWYSAAAALRD